MPSGLFQSFFFTVWFIQTVPPYSLLNRSWRCHHAIDLTLHQAISFPDLHPQKYIRHNALKETPLLYTHMTNTP